MKRLQTGMRVDAEIWGAYRKLCSREKVRPHRPIEEFLRLVVDSDSVSSLLIMMRETAKSRVDGYHAYARVLLDWYTHGKFWTNVQDEELSVEGMLLDALKLVTDVDLRRRIEEALIDNQRSRNTKP